LVETKVTAIAFCSFCHPKAEATHLVIIYELNSGLFEDYLDPDQRRNIAGDFPDGFFLCAESWPSQPRKTILSKLAYNSA
jgi:hypothetical protein